MTDKGDRVDPVVTELSRYKGLLKVQALENKRLRQENKDMRLWLSSLEAAGARMSRVWKRAEVIHKEMVEKQGGTDD